MTNCPLPWQVDTSPMPFLNLRLREHCRIGKECLEEPEDKKVCGDIVPSSCDREVTPIKTQHHGCLKKT